MAEATATAPASAHFVEHSAVRRRAVSEPMLCHPADFLRHGKAAQLELTQLPADLQYWLERSPALAQSAQA